MLLKEQSDGPFLVLSRHDYRTDRKANMHFIAESLSKRDITRFFSFGFSLLSYLKDDPRLSLWSKSNTVEVIEGVECYLWRTPIHPVSLRRSSLRYLENAAFSLYTSLVPKILREWILKSNSIIIESGFPIIFIRLCRELNPSARLVYVASDGLKTIDCANFIINKFFKDAHLLDGIRLPSRELLHEMPSVSSVFFVPHGFDKGIGDHIGASPYSYGLNAVSVGSMLFDPTFFEVAADAFPHIIFHVIGGGAYAAKLSAPNIKVYGEMPFKDTIPYLKYADFGIAPYNDAKVAPYLSDTSMKLMQYGFLGLPAVCPNIVAGQKTGRFGYSPGNRESIISAINSALKFGHFPSSPVLTWDEVTDRILAPHKFVDTRITNSDHG